MEPHEQPHWSYSSLACYLQCPLKYALRYIENAEVERTSASLPFGRAFHAVLSERAIKGSAFKLEEAQADFAVYFRGETDVCENLTFKADEQIQLMNVKAGTAATLKKPFCSQVI